MCFQVFRRVKKYHYSCFFRSIFFFCYSFQFLQTFNGRHFKLNCFAGKFHFCYFYNSFFKIAKIHFMGKLFVYLLGIAFFFGSCEDKKKGGEFETEIDTSATLGNQEIEVEKKDTSNYPEITNENVVSFLTEYGKKNLETKVLITSSFGEIEIELYKDTPLHRANFIYLVKQKYFDDTFFHRVVPDFIIQGGNSDIVSTPRKRNALGNKYLLPAEI